MEKLGTAFALFVEPASNQVFEVWPARAVGMLGQYFPAEFEPDLLHGIGEGERRSVKAASGFGCFWRLSDRTDAWNLIS